VACAVKMVTGEQHCFIDNLFHVLELTLKRQLIVVNVVSAAHYVQYLFGYNLLKLIVYKDLQLAPTDLKTPKKI